MKIKTLGNKGDVEKILSKIQEVKNENKVIKTEEEKLKGDNGLIKCKL